MCKIMKDFMKPFFALALKLIDPKTISKYNSEHVNDMPSLL